MLNVEDVAKFLAEEKGKRKFKQRVELAINFKDIDFNKQDNRLNLDILLPHGTGKSKKLLVFAAEPQIISEAEKYGFKVINGAEIEALAKDQERLKDLLNYDLVAQPSLMPAIAKNLGQFLGPRNKMPKPLLGDTRLDRLAGEAEKKITIKSRGKYLPTVHCVIGSEDMKPEEIYDNINTVVNSISKKIERSNIKSIYMKLTMSKAIKIMG
ncbi:MAG: 50S ribosomal protein L1 [Candidatus Micrarchaeia archaeon]